MPPLTRIPLTPEQQLVVEHAADGLPANALVSACPGSGKTTVLAAAAAALPHGNTLALAFNKSIAKELQSSLPPTVMCKTIHAFLLSLIRTQYRNVELNPERGLKGKNMSILAHSLPTKFKDHLYTVSNLFSYVKNQGHIGDNIPLPEDFLDYMDICGSDFPDDVDKEIIPFLPEAYARIVSNTDVIDFDDVLLFPFQRSLRFPGYDFILVDEAQDLSFLNMSLIAKMAKGNTKFLFCGDPLQSIYAFRGADSLSMDKILKSFNCFPLSLTVSFRCAKSIVTEARQFMPDMQWRPNAPEGSVRTQTEHLNPKLVSSDSLILCRNNAPLLACGLRFLRHSLPVQMRSNAARTILGKLTRFKTDDINIFRERLDAWYKNESETLSKSFRLNKLAMVEDEYESLRAVTDNAKSVDDAKENLERLLRSNSGVRLMTIHSAKGLEAPTVFFLRRDLLPSHFARSELAQQQERNIEFVGITRAKDNLIFCDEGTSR